MKFSIISKGDCKSESIKNKMTSYLLDFDLVYDEEEPDIVISVGGDGTLLHAFHRYTYRLDKTAFVGVHTGHLGFYADWVPEELEKLVIAIAKTPFQIVEYPLLEVIVRYTHGGKESLYLALNEATVKSIGSTFVMDVIIHGQRFRKIPGRRSVRVNAFRKHRIQQIIGRGDYSSVYPGNSIIRNCFH